MEHHAELKDKCDGVETRLDEIASDIREIPFNYKLVDEYTHIDEELSQIYEWYEERKKWFVSYQLEKKLVEDKLNELNKQCKLLNNNVQNIKSQAFSRDRHGGSYSQLQNIQHP